MIQKLRNFGEKLENKGIKCTIYYKHDLDQLEEENKTEPNKNIIFVNNNEIKIFFNAKLSKIEIKTTNMGLKIDQNFLYKLTILNTLVEEYNDIIIYKNKKI